MNTKRHVPAPHGVRLGSLLWVIVFISIFATTGIAYGYLKNQQIKVVRQIKEVEKEIIMFENEAHSSEVRIHDHLGYFEIKDKLSAFQSTLAPLAHGQVEVISETTYSHARELASASSRTQNP